MRKVLLLFFILKFFPGYSQVVIQEVYGAGGNTGAVFHDDYIMLYNNGVSSIDLSSYSIQYAPSTSINGTNWSSLNLTGNIGPSGYYLIRIVTTNTAGIDFPSGLVNISWDLGNSGINANEGKIALMNNQTVINTQVPPVGYIDHLGYGTGGNGANSFEGAAKTGPSNTQTSLARVPLGNDSNNNSADFSSKNASVASGHLPSVLIYPVKLSNFEVFNYNNSTILRFLTTTESNFSHFEIQRSTDAKGFETIGNVKGKGSENEIVEYSFIDEKPFEGLNYYRLKQVDVDNTFEFSKIVSVNIFKDAKLLVYPNPTAEKLKFTNVELEDINSVKIYNFAGKLLYNKHIESLEMDLTGISPQNLLIEINLKDNTSIKRRIVKL